MRLTTTGTPNGIFDSVVGILATKDIEWDDWRERGRRIRLFSPTEEQTEERGLGYRALLFSDRAEQLYSTPHIQRLREVEHLKHDDIIAIEAATGTVRSLYRPYETHHHLFVTERCNSNCLMCSQPPKDRDDVDALTARNLEVISLIDKPPEYLTITGGEPTLLGENLFILISQLKKRMPETELHVLTNGRSFGWPGYAHRFAEVGHPRISIGVPLYSDVAGIHNYVVQAQDAFDQTVAGLHQAARQGIRVEIRVVLHKVTIPRLVKLVEYIYRNLTFAEHIALMGLEYTGYTPRNIDALWIDPYDYRDELEAAVEFLAVRGMNVSVYNHQLCTLNRSVWQFAKKSISDWKNSYLPECQNCAVMGDCGGFFQWAEKKHSGHIHSLKAS